MKTMIITDSNLYITDFYMVNDDYVGAYDIDIYQYDVNHINCYRFNGEVLVLDEEKLARVLEEEEIETRKREQEEAEAKLEADKVKMLTDMMIITREPSDKLGFDFEIYTLGNVELRRVYVPSENHSGTIDDPIPFELGLVLIPNAFYSYDGHLWVYMGQGGVTADDYPVDDVNGWALWE